MRISYLDAVQKYGTILNGVWTKEAEWCVRVYTPKELTWVNSLTGLRVDHIYCNRDMATALQQALQNVVDRGLVAEPKTFDGCFMVRDIRGIPGQVSTHAYALAIDVDAATNRLGEAPTLSNAFVSCFTDAGFLWGGTFRRKDGMHFQFAAW